VVEGACLESVYGCKVIQGSNPCLSARKNQSVRENRLFFRGGGFERQGQVWPWPPEAPKGWPPQISFFICGAGQIPVSPPNKMVLVPSHTYLND
jgi:hypothetical protein